MARLTGQPIIRDRLTEGAVRRLRISAELAGSSFYAFDSGDAKLLAAEVRDWLEVPTVWPDR